MLIKTHIKAKNSLIPTPLVSVLIPCFNSGQYIAETLNSVISQTYGAWECIVVDDHSSDNSVEVIKSFVENNPSRIKFYSNQRKGACAARNLAFEKSQGEYIQYLDADDIISPNKLKCQIELLINNPNHVAVCNTWHFLNFINYAYNTDKEYIYSSNDPADFLINLWGGYGKPHFVQTNAWLTPKSLIEIAGVWNEKLMKDQDGEFFTRVILNSEGIIYSPEAKNFYRKHHSGTNIASIKKRAHIKSIFEATKLKGQYLFERTRSPQGRKAIATQFKLVAIEAWPEFKDISNSALELTSQLGGSQCSPKLGGLLLEVIKCVFGWKAAKSISYYGHKYKRKQI